MSWVENKPLQALCVKIIVENFDRFSGAFNGFEFEETTEKFQCLQCVPIFFKCIMAEKEPTLRYLHHTIPSKHFEFLQRKYSDALLAKLRRSGKLRDEHLPFLLNKYIRALDVRDLKRCSKSEVIDRLLPKISDTLTSLTLCRYFCGCSRRRNGCESQPQCSPKRPADDPNTWTREPMRIDISEDICRNYFVQPDSLRIHKPSLHESCGHDRNLSNDSLKDTIRDFRNLDTLGLAATFCCNDTLKVIVQSCPALRSLDISFCHSISDAGMENLFEEVEKGIWRPCLQLKKINLRESGVRDKGVGFLLTNQKSLEVLIHDKLAKVLLQLHKEELRRNTLDKAEKYNLTFLDIHMSSFMPNDLMVHTTLCPKLKRLNISCYTVDALKVCCRFEQLESIRLRGNFDTPINTFLQVKGAQLINLDLLYCSISPAVLTRTCPNLQNLSLFMVIFLDNPLAWSDKVDWTYTANWNRHIHPEIYLNRHTLSSRFGFKLPESDNVEELPVTPLNFLESFSEYIAEVADGRATTHATSDLLTVCPKLEILRLVTCGNVCPDINEALVKCVSKLKEKDFRYSNVQLSFQDSTLLRSITLQKVDVQSTKEVFDWTDNLLDMLRLTKKPIDVHWGYFVNRYNNQMQ